MYGYRAIVGLCLFTLAFLTLPGARAAPDEEEPYVLTGVQVGVGPWAVAVNPDTNRVYVGNYYKDTVSVIDTLTHRVVATFWARTPASITVDRETGRVYVGADAGVVVIDGHEDRVLSRVTLGPRRSVVTDIEVNGRARRVYALLDRPYGGTDSVFAIDQDTHGIRGELDSSSQLSGLDIDRGTGSLVVVDSAARRVDLVDCDCGGVLESIAIGVQGSYSSLDPRTGRFYVSGSGKIAVLDLESDELIDTLPLSGQVAVDPVRSRLYVLGTTELTAVDARSHEILDVLPIRPYASGLLVNPFSGRVYVASRWSNRVTIVDGETLEIVAELPKSTHLGYPFTIHLGLDPWEERVYVPDFGCHRVTVIQDVTGKRPPRAKVESP